MDTSSLLTTAVVSLTAVVSVLTTAIVRLFNLVEHVREKREKDRDKCDEELKSLRIESKEQTCIIKDLSIAVAEMKTHLEYIKQNR